MVKSTSARDMPSAIAWLFLGTENEHPMFSDTCHQKSDIFTKSEIDKNFLFQNILITIDKKYGFWGEITILNVDNFGSVSNGERLLTMKSQ